MMILNKNRNKTINNILQELNNKIQQLILIIKKVKNKRKMKILIKINNLVGVVLN